MSDQYKLDDEIKENTETKEPSKYKVILLNDDFTTMEFVVEVLKVIFKKSNEEAIKIMLDVHKNGRGICGIYPFEIAETKIEQVRLSAKKNNYPLRVVMEEE